MTESVTIRPPLRRMATLVSNALLKASTDLTHWTAIATNDAVAGSFVVTDGGGVAMPRRFYRVSEEK